MKTIISSILMVLGFIMIAGSAGDCDGKCMELGNTIGEMLMYASMGLALFVAGGYIAILDNNK
jgi:hypothetical protein|tara:strand:- start:391 stop:579 length:189 start_codon:yes stop_codon:yes gene_type:complete